MSIYVVVLGFGLVLADYEKAEAGCLFCRYMIGNTYYFLDVIEIGDRSEQEFGSREAWDNWRREQMEKSIPWFEKAFSGGMGLAGRNYRNYYGDGRGDLIPPDEQGLNCGESIIFWLGLV